MEKESKLATEVLQADDEVSKRIIGNLQIRGEVLELFRLYLYLAHYLDFSCIKRDTMDFLGAKNMREKAVSLVKGLVENLCHFCAVRPTCYLRSKEDEVVLPGDCVEFSLMTMRDLLDVDVSKGTSFNVHEFLVKWEYRTGERENIIKADDRDEAEDLLADKLFDLIMEIEADEGRGPSFLDVRRIQKD